MDIRMIYRNLISGDDHTLSTYRKTITKITNFVDQYLYVDENFIYSFCKREDNNLNINLYYNTPVEKLEEWPAKKVQTYIDATFETYTNLYLVNNKLLNQTIFFEIRSFMDYYTDVIRNDINLINKGAMKINDRDFFYQCEVLEYMYSFYDKINGIFNHLRLKYLNQKNDTWIDEKFHIEFSNNVRLFARPDADLEKAEHDIAILTDSTLWHYLRRLRNKITHDFFDPSLEYNFLNAIKLLYINICRTVFLLDATIMKDEDIRLLIQKNKVEE
jgi:hypothetical protein